MPMPTSATTRRGGGLRFTRSTCSSRGSSGTARTSCQNASVSAASASWSGSARASPRAPAGHAHPGEKWPPVLLPPVLDRLSPTGRIPAELDNELAVLFAQIQAFRGIALEIGADDLVLRRRTMQPRSPYA